MAIKSEQATASQTRTSRIPALDGVRGVAILLVLFLHFSGAPSASIGLPAAFVDKAWLRFAGVGWVGVDLFFVLSGFLITSILYDAKGPALAFFKNFYARRALRIFPVYYAMLVFLFFVLPWVIPGEEAASAKLRETQLWLWFYLINIQGYVDSTSLAGTIHLVAHLWSLAIEEQYYLVWPLIVFLFGRRSLIAITAVLFVAAVAVRFAMIANGDAAIHVVVLLPARMDALAVGSGIALLVLSQQGRAFLSAVAWPVTGAAFVGLVALFIYKHGLTPADPTVARVGLSLVAVFFGGVVAAVVLAPPASTLARILSWQPLRVLGKYSYAIYVIHFPVVAILVRHTNFASDISSWAGFQLPGIIAAGLVALAITLALTLLSWRLIETPYLNLRSSFSSGQVRMSWRD